MVETYHVKVVGFEGPFDMLLDLIEKRKLFINDISLSAVTDEYIEYVRQKELPLAHRAEFIVIASTLLLIKSKSLLPTLELTQEESASIEELSERLKEYQKIRKLAEALEKIFGKKCITMPSDRASRDMPLFVPSSDLSQGVLGNAIKNLIAELPFEKEWQTAKVPTVVHLETILTSLTARIEKGIRHSFNELSGKGREHKVHVIVHFIALLELIKQGILSAHNDLESRDILIETSSPIHGHEHSSHEA